MMGSMGAKLIEGKSVCREDHLRFGPRERGVCERETCDLVLAASNTRSS